MSGCGCSPVRPVTRGGWPGRGAAGGDARVGVLAGASRRDSPLLAPTLDRLDDLGPLPDDITVHLDAGYDSDKTRALLDERGFHAPDLLLDIIEAWRTAPSGAAVPQQT